MHEIDSPPPLRHPMAVKAGKIADRLGQLTLPMVIGVLGGFYAADQGVPLLPTMLEITIGWGLAALLLIAVGRWLRGRAFVDSPEGTRVRRRIVAALALAVALLAGRLGVHIAEGPSDLTSIPLDQFDLAFEQDAQRYREHDEGMERLLQRLSAEGALQVGPDGVLSAAQERLVVESWRALFDYSIALDQTRVYYEDYWRFDPSRVQRSYHLRSFLLTYAAELSLYEKAARFSSIVLQSDSAKRFLDAPHPDLDLPEGSFSRFRQELLGTRDQARVIAGESYLETLDALAGGQKEARALGVGWLWDDIERHLDTIDAVAPIDRAALTVRADAQLLKREVRRVWFPLQKGVAEGMGDTRVRRVGRYLIEERHLAPVRSLMEPGDILLARKNWYLSNVGLPGFWPHAILYLGEPEALSAFFDSDPETAAWIREESGKDLTFLQFLHSRHPTASLVYQLGHDGEKFDVIEAISEGISFTPLVHTAGDYLGAMRPRLSKKARAQAIDYAFSQHTKPYDFDFDFATDHALVCTELVWRAYRPAPGKEGLTLDLVTVAGRQTMPANEMARQYTAARGAETQQLDFVYFLDASEERQEVFPADEAAFAASHERPQWDIAQK